MGHLTAEVVVVDNDSADGTARIVAARRDARLVRAQNLGYAAGINRGVRAASGAAVILILNPDIRLAPGSVPPLLRALQTPGTGIAVPQIRSPDGLLQFSLRHEPSLLRALGLGRWASGRFSEYVCHRPAYAARGTADWALGAVLMMSRACYAAIGGWDESYFLYSEETDACLRARDIGWLTRYEPAAVAVHIGGQSGRSHDTHVMQIINRIRLYRRRHRAAASWAYLALILAGQFFWLARGRPECRSAITAILRPASRPAQLGCGQQMMPR